MKTKPEIVVVDDFMPDPDAVRRLASCQEFVASDYYKGRRTARQFLASGYRDAFEALLGRKIVRWAEHDMNGTFQLCVSGDPIVYHSDMQTHAGILFLTPDAPPEAGVSFYRSRVTGIRRAPGDELTERRTYPGNYYDSTKWELVEKIGNFYNRLVLWDGRLIHAPSAYFGNHIDDGRLFQIFFYDAE